MYNVNKFRVCFVLFCLYIGCFIGGRTDIEHATIMNTFADKSVFAENNNYSFVFENKENKNIKQGDNIVLIYDTKFTNTINDDKYIGFVKM